MNYELVVDMIVSLTKASKMTLDSPLERPSMCGFETVVADNSNKTL